MNINKLVIILSLAVAFSMTALTVSHYAGGLAESGDENSGITVEDIIAEEENGPDNRDKIYLKSERD